MINSRPDKNKSQLMFYTDFEIYHYQTLYEKNVFADSLHHHDFYEIYFFLGGKMSMNVEGKIYNLKKGDVLLISPMELHQATIYADENPYDRIILWVNKEFLKNISCDDYSLIDCFDSKINLLEKAYLKHHHIQYFTNHLLEEYSSETYMSQNFCRGYLQLLMAEINKIHKKLTDESPKKNESVQNGKLIPIIKYINENYNKNITLDLLAKLFYMSKYHISHLFSDNMNTTVHQYLTSKRLQIATQLLAKDIPVKNIYSMCGFRDYSNFYRVFKSTYDITPTEYIALLDKKGNISDNSE